MYKLSIFKAHVDAVVPSITVYFLHSTHSIFWCKFPPLTQRPPFFNNGGYCHQRLPAAHHQAPRHCRAGCCWLLTPMFQRHLDQHHRLGRCRRRRLEVAYGLFLLFRLSWVRFNGRCVSSCFSPAQRHTCGEHVIAVAFGRTGARHTEK